MAGLTTARDALELAGAAAGLAGQIVDRFDLADPLRRAAFLRGRADRLRTRAEHARRRRQRDRLHSRARGLDLRADALDPRR